jgi:hypothetical protein
LSLNRHTADYRDRVEPIRHKVYAHAGKITRDERDRLFTGVKVRELERLTVFPLRLDRALSMLFENGLEPALGDPVTIIGEVLRNSPEKGQSTWEHYQQAGDAALFLRALVVARKSNH